MTRKEEAYRRILEIVLKGQVADNDYLTEQRLAEAFGMSRAPVREALQSLCAERIMVNLPRMGYRVAPISLRETLDAIDVRLLLECESVRRACRNRNPRTLALLDQLISRELEIREDEADIHSWIVNGDILHASIAEMSDNIVLVRSITSLLDLLRRASIQLILEGREKPEGIHYHLAILEAIRRGDEAEAEGIMRKDIMILSEIILRR